MDGLIQQFTQGALGTGVDTVVVNELQEAAPPSSMLAPHLLELLPRAGEKGRFAIAHLAAALAAGPGYRPVVKAAVREGRVESAYWGSFLRTGTSLDGESLRWWLDLVSEPRATAGVLVALDQRLAAVLPAERDAVAAFVGGDRCRPGALPRRCRGCGTATLRAVPRQPESRHRRAARPRRPLTSTDPCHCGTNPGLQPVRGLCRRF